MLPGQLGLLLQWLQLSPKLGHHVLQPVQVDVQPGQLPFRPFATAPVLGDPRRLLDELPPVLGARSEHVLQVPLRDDGVQCATDAAVREQLLDVQQPARASAQPVLAVARAQHRAADLDLLGGHGDQAGGVVDDEFHLGHRRLLSRRAPREDHVGHLAPAQRPRALFAQHPRDGVGDVRLARAIGSDDDADARSELEHRLVGERLEAADGQLAQEHVAVAA